VHKRFIVLLGVLLGGHVPAVAQTSAQQIVLAREPLAPIKTMLRTVSTPSPAGSFLLSQGLSKSPADFSSVFAGAYERGPSVERLLPTEEVKTLFLTKSSLPLFQPWGGRLRLDAFQSTLDLQTVQLGPLGRRGTQTLRSPGQTYSAGLSLSFQFGRHARTGPPAQAWRRMTQLVGAALH
jgi:hypothetical protein